MTLETSVEDRFLIFKLMQATVQCTTCKTGPIDTSDVSKLLAYGKIWDLLDLSVFENLAQEELINLFKDTQIIVAEFKSETLRYIIDLFFSRGYALNTLFPAVPFLNKLLALARTNNVKLNIQEETTEIDETKTIALTFEQLEGLALALTASTICKAEFHGPNNKILIHGVPTDMPKNINEYNKLLRILDALKLTDVLTGSATIAPYGGMQDYIFENVAMEYLHDLVARRSTVVNFPQHKLAGIIKALS